MTPPLVDGAPSRLASSLDDAPLVERLVLQDAVEAEATQVERTRASVHDHVRDVLANRRRLRRTRDAVRGRVQS